MKLLNIFLSILALFLLAYLAICFWLYKNQEKLLFFPQQLDENYQFNFEGSFEEVFLDTPDGERVHGIYFSSENPRGVILAFHGNGEALHLAGHEAISFVELGYDVLMSDYRNYGKSSGMLSEENLFNDAALFYQHLLQRNWTPGDITIYGRSIGSGVASHLASAVKHKRVILTTPYFSMYHLASESYPVIPMSLVLRYPLRNDLHLQKVTTPIHIFHGTNDYVIPFHQAKRLAAHVSKDNRQEERSFTVIEGGNHNGLSDHPAYKAKMREILR